MLFARKIKIKKPKAAAVTMLVVALSLTLAQHYGLLEEAAQTTVELQPGLYRVVEFDDGDTIKVDMNGTEETIRFIGVDTPETHDPRKAVQCYGHAASDFTENLIGDSAVRLAADPLNTNRDRYDRLLRYVYLPDGTLVNAEIIKQGYGFAYLSFPITKEAEFRAYQQEAMAANRGLWDQCKPYENDYGGYTSNDAE